MLRSNQNRTNERQELVGAAARHQPAHQESNLGFYLVLVAMIFEFGRPQDFLPPLKIIPFPSLIDVSLALAVFSQGKSSFANKQTKLWIGLAWYSWPCGCHLRITTFKHS